MAVKSEQLQSTRVLVTGGTTGLGRAMAAALAASGARVVLTSRDTKLLENLMLDLNKVHDRLVQEGRLGPAARLGATNGA